MYGILLQHLFLCHGSCVQSITGFLYGRCERLFVTELTHEYFTRHNILKEFFEWLCVKWQFASITS